VECANEGRASGELASAGVVDVQCANEGRASGELASAGDVDVEYAGEEYEVVLPGTQ